MTALYSVNLRIMGRSNIPLTNEKTIVSLAESSGQRLFNAANVPLLGWEVSVRDLSLLLLVPLLIVVVCVAAVCVFPYGSRHCDARHR